MLYDPIRRHLAIEKIVTQEGLHGQEKKYYRIRPARWYGGIITADVLAVVYYASFAGCRTR